ncbi:hypothetical protein Tco_0917734, partial [Tanacetum coccineum]
RTSFDKETILWAYGTPICDLTLYMSLAGDLQYLTFTRLDMSYRVQQVALLLVVLLSAIMFFLATTYWSCKRQYTLSRSSAEVMTTPRMPSSWLGCVLFGRDDAKSGRMVENENHSRSETSTSNNYRRTHGVD